MPSGVYEREAPEKRFWKFVDDTGSCQLWTGAKSGKGYGYFGNLGYAHRFAYEMKNGKIPDGMVIDHLCRVHSCVNPDHLEAVTNSENVRRGEAPRAARERAKKISKCPKGHEYSEENTRMRNGKRHCKTCGALAAKDYDARNREKRMLAAREYRARKKLNALGMLPSE